LQFLLRVSLATFFTDQPKSAPTVSELLESMRNAFF
jgi:hypothetical protein